MFGLTGFLRHGSSAASTIDFVIGGDYRFTKTGIGTTTMAALHTYTGATIIKQGYLHVSSLANGGSPSHIGASGASASNLVFSGGILRYSGATVAIDRDFTINNSVTGEIEVVTGGVTLTIGGIVSGGSAANFRKSGSGNITLTAPLTGTLNTLYSAGAGIVNLSAGAVGSPAVIILSNGCGVDLGGADLSCGALSGSPYSSVALGANTLTITAGSDTTYSGTITGTGGITRNGGTRRGTFNGSFAYTGPTTILAGLHEIAALANGGANSNLGASSAAASNLIISGTLRCTGNGTQSTDRAFTIPNGTTGTIDNTGINGTHSYNGGSAATTGALRITQGVGSQTVLLNGTFQHTGVTTADCFIGGTGTLSGGIAMEQNRGVHGGTGPGNAGTLTAAFLDMVGISRSIRVYSDGVGLSKIELGSGAFTTPQPVLVNLMEAMPVGVFTIIGSTAASPVVLPTIGTNSSGRTPSLAWVPGTGLALTLV